LIKQRDEALGNRKRLSAEVGKAMKEGDKERGEELKKER
jgi:hypothetical protein